MRRKWKAGERTDTSIKIDLLPQQCWQNYSKEVSDMKCNTQNKKIAAITENSLVVGIDVGSEKHFARVFDWRRIELSKKAFEFSNDEEGFNDFLNWIEEIKLKYGKTEVLPGMEPTGHYWLNLGIYLQEHGMKPVHVNPHHVKKSKELDDNNPSKNDRKDPKVIAGLVNDGRYNGSDCHPLLSELLHFPTILFLQHAD